MNILESEKSLSVDGGALRLLPMGGEHAGAWLRWREQALSQRFNPLLPLSESYLAHRLEHACTGDLSDRKRSEYRWVVDLRGASVGTVAAMNPSWSMGYAEIGYMLDEAHQGRGLGTRAVALLVDKLFGETDIHRLYAMISPENAASLRLIQRLGFVYEGRMREHYLIQGRRADEMIYGLLRREWEQKRLEVGGWMSGKTVCLLSDIQPSTSMLCVDNFGGEEILMSEHLTKEIFARHLNTTFRAFYAEGEALELELIEVGDPDERKESKPKRQERFSVLFRGQKEKLLWHGIYKLQHEEMGEFELYMGPVDKDEAGFYYEAVFNRLSPR